jgi:hypothetical protein
MQRRCFRESHIHHIPQSRDNTDEHTKLIQRNEITNRRAISMLPAFQCMHPGG